jgi:hypothetical protein
MRVPSRSNIASFFLIRDLFSAKFALIKTTFEKITKKMKTFLACPRTMAQACIIFAPGKSDDTDQNSEQQRQ